MTSLRILVVPAALAFLLWGTPLSSGEPDGPSAAVRERCGSYCLYTALQLFEKSPAEFRDLEKQLGPPSDRGYTLEQLKNAAEFYGLSTLAVTTTLDVIKARRSPLACLVHLNDSHFALIAEAHEAGVLLVDPPHVSLIPTETFLAQWSGVCLLLADSPLEPESKVANRVRRNFIASRAGIGLAGLFLVVLSWITFRRLRTRVSAV